MKPLDRRQFLRENATIVLGAAAVLSGVVSITPGAAPDPAPAAAAPKPAPSAARGRATRPREIKTGGARLVPVDGKYHVWTKKVGTGSIPVLTLHGGPGTTHEYLECFEDFLPRAGVTFHYYDQLGSAYSDQPDDPSLWTLERFREEVEQVRRQLGLDKFILYGHSWGGMLGIEYALKYQQHLSGLVISNMTAGIASYVAYINELRAQFPPEIIAALEKYETKGEYENPEYQDAMLNSVYRKHVCRLDPWPEPLERAFKHFNTKVYKAMQGPNEFVVTGTLKDWDRWKSLPEIKVPTLLLVGRYDTMKVDDVRTMGRLIPKSRVTVCENGSHMSLYDDQEAYFDSLVSFLKQVHGGTFRPSPKTPA